MKSNFNQFYIDITKRNRLGNERVGKDPEAKSPHVKGIRISESRKVFLVESGILGFGIRNSALGIRNPTKDWNPHWIKLLARKKNHLWKAFPGYIPQRDDIQCNIGISGVKTIVHELHMKDQGHGQRGNPCL